MSPRKELDMPWTVWFWPVVLSAVALFLWRSVLRLAPALWVAFLVYGGFYILTTLIGATIISLTDAAVLEQLGWGLDVNPLKDVGSKRYWLMLFAPLIVPPITFLVLYDFRLLDQLILEHIPDQNCRISSGGFCAVFGLLAGYCVYRLAQHGHLFAILTWQSAKSDYVGLIAARYDMFDTLGSAFFGITYVGLPTLSFVALHQAVQTRQRVWAVLTCLAVGTVAFLSISLIQKSPLVLYFAFLGIALFDLKVVTLRSIALVGALILICLTALQSLMLEDWGIDRTVNLVIFRMAQSFPYYLNVFPDLVPFSGIETGLHLIGIGKAADDNNVVFNVMYPSVVWTQGSAPGPAHLRAYSQAGLWYAAVTLIVVGLAFKGIQVLYRKRESPLAFALYMGLFIHLYYVTQTSLREAVVSCYGYFWVIASVAFTMLATHRTAPAPPRTTSRPATVRYEVNRPRPAASSR
jgi:hypothetical protein